MSARNLTLKCCLLAVLGLVFLVLALWSGSGDAEGRTITVDDDGGEDYETIQEAIDAADEGDKIEVREGTYYERITLDKTLTIEGEGMDRVTIDGENGDDVVTIIADWCNLSGFRVINSSSRDDKNGITVRSDHNHIYENNCSGHRYGIFLENADHNNCSWNLANFNRFHGIRLNGYSDYNEIHHNTCQENSGGITLDGYSNYNDISQNNCSFNKWCGIYTGKDCTFNKVSNNICYYNGDAGICIRDCRSNTFSLNFISRSEGNGIEIRNAPSTILKKNQISGSDGYGIFLYRSSEITLTGNQLVKDSFFISDLSAWGWSRNTIDSSNTVNGKPIHYIVNQTGDSVPDGAGLVIIANCSNIVVENQDFDGHGEGVLAGFSRDISLLECRFSFGGPRPIYLYHCENFSIMDNDITGSARGFYIDNLIYGNISGNRISGNDGDGIYARNSERVVFRDNLIRDNTGSGISLESSRYCTVSGNDCQGHTGTGISVIAPYSVVENNSCSGNQNGIVISTGSGYRITNNSCSTNVLQGLRVFEVKDSVVSDNVCSANPNINLYVMNSENIKVMNNTCSGGEYGLEVSGGKKNHILGNNCSFSEFTMCVHYSENSVVENNNCRYGSRAGISLRGVEGSSNTLRNNTLEGCGFRLMTNSPGRWKCFSIDTTNTVNGRPVQYRKEESGGSITDAGQVILVDCHDMDISGSSFGVIVAFSTNCTFTNITGSEAYEGSYIYQCSWLSVQSSSFERNGNMGIHISESDNVSIENSVVRNNELSGIVISKSDDCVVKDCLVENSSNSARGGIYLEGSKRCTIQTSTIRHNNGTGIKLAKYPGKNQYTRISDCDISDNHGGVTLNFENTVIENSSFTGNELAIYFYSDWKSLVANCSFTDNDRVIQMFSGDGSTIRDCSIEGNGDGINLSISGNKDVTVSGCVIRDNTFGLWHKNGNNCLVENTIVEDCRGFGIEMFEGSLLGCTIGNNSVGATIYHADSVRNNRFFNNGLKLESICSDVSGNMVNGKPLVYYHNEAELEISELAGQIILHYCENITIRNQEITDTDHGIVIWNSKNCSVLDSEVSDNSLGGIKLLSSEFITLENMIVSRNGGYGITFTTHDSVITGCLVKENQNHGIYLSGNNNLVENSTIRDHTGSGIFVQDYDHARILNCSIRDNSIGVEMSQNPLDVVLKHNSIARNSLYGVLAHDDIEEEVDARDNWWGRRSGPYHQEKNPGGGGDKINGSMKFDPWLQRGGNWRPLATTISVSPALAIEKETIIFKGKGEDDGMIVSYLWTSSIDGVLFNGTSSEFSVSNLSIGTHTIALMIQNDLGLWSDGISTTLTINGRPVAGITGISPGSAAEGESFEFRAGSTDDGSIVRYVWISSLDGEIYNGTEAAFQSSDLSVGEHEITLRVQDDQGAWSEGFSSKITVKEKGENDPGEPGEEEDSGDSDDGFLPGFELFLLFASLGFCLALRKS